MRDRSTTQIGCYHYSRQQGAVLIIALFVVSIIVAVTARFTSDFQLSATHAGRHIANIQLQQFLRSTEDFASWALINDKENEANGNPDEPYDHYGEQWAQPLQVPINDNHVTVTMKLEDAAGLFNINQLQGRPEPYNPGDPFNKRLTSAQQQFVRLLQTLPDNTLDSALALQITEAVIDWIDKDDDVVQQGGAETGYYRSLDPPYRAANTLFTSVSELRQVKGMTDVIYNDIAPYLIALPETDTGININTAPVAIIRSIGPKDVETPLSEEQASELIDQRPKKPTDTTGEDTTALSSGDAFSSIDDFLQRSVSGSGLEVDTKNLTTGSHYFILHTEVAMSDYKRQQISILKRGSTFDGSIKVMVVRRTREQL